MNWTTQTWTLLQRSFRNAAHTQLRPIPIIQMLLVALIVGLVWIDSTLTEATIRDRVGALFFIALFAGAFTPAINAVHSST